MGWQFAGVLLLVALVTCPSHAESKYNVSFADLHNCKQFNAVSGYNYRAFFKLHTLEHHRPNETDMVVDLLLYVMASRDGHILLTAQPNATADAIEIVIGGGGNTFSQIRLGQKGKAIKTKTSTALLSPVDALPLRLQVAASGQIKVFAGNLTAGDAFMETVVPASTATALQYLSFTTWGTAMASWFYDCPAPMVEAALGNDTAPAEKTELELMLDSMDRLRQEFRAAPLPAGPPEGDFDGVRLMRLHLKGFRYDQASSLVELSGWLSLAWQDPRYSWDMEQYDRSPLLGDACPAIWTPSFEPTSLFSGDFAGCFIMSEGDAYARIKEFTWVNFCAVSDSYRWPYDRNECRLRLSVAGYDRPVRLWMEGEPVTYEDDIEESEWSLTQLDAHEIPGTSPAIELHLVMDRKSDIHSASIYPTYFVANLLIYISFLADGRSRLLLNSLGLLVLLNTFLSMSVVVPGGAIPKIYVFFLWSLVFYSISSLLFVVDLWLKRKRTTIAPRSWVNRAISFPALRYALAMDQRSNYDTLEQKNVRWDEVTCVLNRVMMLVAIVVFCVGFVKP